MTEEKQDRSAIGALPPPHQPEPVSYRRLLRWAVVVVSGSWPLFLTGVLLNVAAVVLGLYSVRLVSKIIGLIGGQHVGGVLWLVGRFAIVSVLAIALPFAARVTTIRANGAMLKALQQKLHDKLLTMPTSFHDTYDLGETSTIVLQDAAGCQPMLRELIAYPATQGVALVSAVYFLVQGLNDLRSVPVGAQLVLAVVVLVVPPIAWRLSSRQRHAYEAVRAAQGAVASEFENSATSPSEVQLLGAEAQRSRAFARRLGELIGLQIRAQTNTELENQFQHAVPALLQAGFLGYAAWVAAGAGATAAGALLSIYYFVPKVIQPLDEIIQFLAGLQMMWAQAARVGAILDFPEAPPAPPGALPDGAATIAFDQVALAYPAAQTPVLRDLSHVFPAGRITAIVGRSGCGKSSALALIDGLRAPDSGSVCIDGRPIASIDPATRREMIAIVSQSPLLIADTVRANFQLARMDATDAEIEAAARTAGLWPALVKLGGDRPLDIQVPRSAGRGLSGGERRLLAVARVLLRRPRILLLDEPTTGVDTVGIATLLAGLRAACAGLTVVMVEHNLDFVCSLADQVCCLEDGRFSDVGSPAELAGRPGLFRNLLTARERLTSTAGLDLQSVPLPSIAAGRGPDPWLLGQPPKAPPPQSAGSVAASDAIAEITATA